MGSGAWSPAQFKSTAANVKGRTASDIFRTDPDDRLKGGQIIRAEDIQVRESCDSEEHPESNPVIVGLDVTGSMHFIPERLVKGGLGTLMDSLGQRNIIPDPQLMFMGIGDATQNDDQPLQATQFESDNRITEQLMDLYLEGGGGGNNFENYELAWAMALYRIKTDAWQKRQKPGYLFTVGDEEFPYRCDPDYMSRVFKNYGVQDPKPADLLSQCQEYFNIFHIMIAEGSHFRDHADRVKSSWRQHLKRRAIVLYDYTYLAPLIVTCIDINEGQNVEDALSYWDQSTQNVLRESLEDVDN